MNNQNVSSHNSMPNRPEVDTDTTRHDYEQLDDNKLLSLIGSNQDRSALSELYSRYQLPVARFLQRQMQETRPIEEVYNDVMLTVWQKAGSFRGDSKVSTWLFGIAYRTRLAHYRKESRHNHDANDEIINNIASDTQEQTESDITVKEALQAALVELSISHRAVIELSYFHGYSTSEIARIVGIPQNTVKTRLFHARKKLKTILLADQTGTQRPRSFATPQRKREQPANLLGQNLLLPAIS